MSEATTTKAAAEARDAETAQKSAAAGLSIAAAAFLIVLKTVTGLLTGSISVWASLLDSAMDIFASTINYFAVRASARPPDEDHAYGHGKVESLAGLFQAVVITLSGLFLIREAILRIINPPETSGALLGVGSMLVATGVSIALVARLRRVARQTDSPALNADAMHYATDVYTNGGAFCALLLLRLTGWRLADPIISIAISLYILASAFSVARDSIDVLMDKRLPLEVDEQISEIVGRFRTQGVVGHHDVRTRRSGAQKFIDLHLEVERDQSLEAAHALTVQVIRAIEAGIPRARVQIHTDPAGEKHDQ
jgi:ferrous-iron efflux pump FieF